MKDKIKSVSKYIKSKYPGRYTLKISQAATELRMTDEKVKELIENRVISTLSIKAISTFIVNNPPKLV